MKTIKLIKSTLCVAILAVFALVGCEKLDTYSIDAPSDLQSRIDSIADAKAGVDTGDTTYIDIATAIVGDEDNSAAWWTAFSDYFAIPTNKLLTIEFINHSSGVENWNNWNLAVTNEVADRDADNYAEYFVLRSDAFGWGGAMGDEGYTFDVDVISHNYSDIAEDGSEFRATMQGAYVTMEVDHSATGNVYVKATALGTNGIELVLTYHQEVSATNDINAFLVCDGSYFEMKKAYLLPSKITTVEDVVPVSIDIQGAPDFIEFGNEDFWGDATANVTYSDGSSEKADTADISFTVIPDMTTLGEKTVVVSYNKSKQGKYGKTISTYYIIEVTNPVLSLEVTTLPNITKYYFFSSDSILFNNKGLVVTATYSDESTGVLANSNLKFKKIPAVEGAQNVIISYEGSTNIVTTTTTVTLVKGVGQVGATDFSTGWWTEFSDDYVVASGESKTLTMYCYSNNLQNFHSPSTILRKADMTEFGVVRMDNYGWGDGYDTATPTNDWDFDLLASNINGSKIVITVTNKGDNTADIIYNVTYANGETHFQKYEGITVDSTDLNCALVLEGAYLVFIE